MVEVVLLLIISQLEEICICANYFHISHMPTIGIYVLKNVEIVEKTDAHSSIYFPRFKG